MESEGKSRIEPALGGPITEYNDKAGLFLCLSGTAEIMVNSQVYRLERGRLYIISPLIMIYRVSQSADFGGIHIVDGLEVFYSVVHSLIGTLLELKLRHSPCLQLSEDDMWLVMERRDLIERKRRERDQAVDAERLLLTRMIHLIEQETLLEVIGIYFRNRTVEPLALDRREAVVYAFIFALHQHFKTQRSVTFYAEEARLSVGYFSSVVRQKTGRTPQDWIAAITIAQAKLLLEKTTKSVKEIAAELNFPEQFTFRKYFKQHTGMPPSEYRAHHNPK